MKEKVDEILVLLDRSHAFLIVLPELEIQKIVSELLNQLPIESYSAENILIIEADGKSINKHQINEIKTKFKYNESATDKSIYIVKNAEKMNDSSYNSLLKFLEEPFNDVKALLLTSRLNNVPATIKSRCQIYSFMKTETEQADYKYLFDLVKNKEYFLYREEMLSKIKDGEDFSQILEFLVITTKNKELLKVLEKIDYNVNQLLTIDEIYYILSKAVNKDE